MILRFTLFPAQSTLVSPSFSVNSLQSHYILSSNNSSQLSNQQNNPAQSQTQSSTSTSHFSSPEQSGPVPRSSQRRKSSRAMILPHLSRKTQEQCLVIRNNHCCCQLYCADAHEDRPTGRGQTWQRDYRGLSRGDCPTLACAGSGHCRSLSLSLLLLGRRGERRQTGRPMAGGAGATWPPPPVSLCLAWRGKPVLSVGAMVRPIQEKGKSRCYAWDGVVCECVMAERTGKFRGVRNEARERGMRDVPMCFWI